MTAAGYAVINEVVQPGFMQDVKHKSEFLQQCLNKLAKKHKLGTARGRGLLLALDTQTIDATIIVKHAFKQKLLLNAPR